MTMPMTITMPMTSHADTGALLKLTNWLSPSYPVGAFSYSHGLEQAVAENAVQDAASAKNWLEDILRHGAGRTDAIFLAHAWRAAVERDRSGLDDVAELASAFFPCAERRLEAIAQGEAFLGVTADVWPASGVAQAPMPHAVAVGAYAGAHGAALETALALYLQSFLANLVFAAIRLVPLGQTEGQHIVAALHPAILQVAADAMTAELDDIGGCTMLADLAAMDHETLETRLFRT